MSSAGQRRASRQDDIGLEEMADKGIIVVQRRPVTKRPYPAHTLVECPVQHICQVSWAGAAGLVILRAHDISSC